MDILMQLLAGQERMVAKMDSLDGRMDSLDGRMDSLDGRLDNTNGTLMLLGNVIHQAIETLKPRFEDHERRIQAIEAKVGR